MEKTNNDTRRTIGDVIPMDITITQGSKKFTFIFHMGDKSIEYMFNTVLELIEHIRKTDPEFASEARTKFLEAIYDGCGADYEGPIRVIDHESPIRVIERG